MTPRKRKGLTPWAWQMRSIWLSLRGALLSHSARGAHNIASASSLWETCAQAEADTYICSPAQCSMLFTPELKHQTESNVFESYVFSLTSYQYIFLSVFLLGGNRAILCVVDKPTLLFFHCLFFCYFKFCLNPQEKGTANGFVFDSTVSSS